MMNRTLAHHHRTHPYTLDTHATGHVAAGGTAHYRWDGQQWQPEGRTDAATILGPLTDPELRSRLNPDPTTLLTLGGHWADRGRATWDD